MSEVSLINPNAVKLAFIGAGRMAEAIMSGLIKGRALPAADIIATDVDDDRLHRICERYGVHISTDNIAAARAANYILLAVKPQQLDEAVRGFQGALSAEHVLITIAAGVSTVRIRSLLDRDIPIVRVMPNTPALVNAGISAIALPAGLPESAGVFIEKIFAAVGDVVYVGEGDLNAVTALSGSGPAYFFSFVRELTKAGVAAGLPPDLAARLTRATFYGSARLLEAGPADEDGLIRAVSSPGGTTEAALNALDGNGFGDIIVRAVAAAAARAQELE